MENLLPHLRLPPALSLLSYFSSNQLDCARGNLSPNLTVFIFLLSHPIFDKHYTFGIKQALPKAVLSETGKDRRSKCCCNQRLRLSKKCGKSSNWTSQSYRSHQSDCKDKKSGCRVQEVTLLLTMWPKRDTGPRPCTGVSLPTVWKRPFLPRFR